MIIVTPEFQKTIQDLIDNLQAEQFPDAEEYKLAQKYHALPLGFDFLAYVFLTPNGEVIWEDFQDEVGSSDDLQGLIRVLVAGKRRYPQLAKQVSKSFIRFCFSFRVQTLVCSAALRSKETRRKRGL